MMGLFGSIGRALGGVIKGVGTVASIASAVAPIPGLGAAGKLARGFGGLIGKAKKAQHLIQTVASGGQLKPGVLAAMSPVMPGGAVLTAGAARGMFKTRPKRGTKKRRRKVGAYRIRRRGKRRRGRGSLTSAQLRAGFGGKRRMRG